MKRSYYSEHFESFVKNSDDQILGELTKQHKFELDINQRNAWQEQIKILKKSGIVNGVDTLIKKRNTPQGLGFSIRFHIYPGISAIKTLSGQSILLQINQKKSWMLISDGHNLEIEKGLFMGRNKVVSNNCAVIYGNTNQQDTCIKWELKRSV